jgi:hypothetical protein
MAELMLLGPDLLDRRHLRRRPVTGQVVYIRSLGQHRLPAAGARSSEALWPLLTGIEILPALSEGRSDEYGRTRSPASDN